MIFKTLFYLSASTLLISGCAKEEPRSKSSFENDRKYCYHITNKRLNISEEGASNIDSLRLRDSLINACMEEEKGWDQESLNQITEYKFENYL